MAAGRPVQVETDEPQAHFAHLHGEVIAAGAGL